MQLNEAKQHEVIKENLESSFQKLKGFLKCTQDLSQDDLICALESKLTELSSKSEEILDLQTTINQKKKEVQ